MLTLIGGTYHETCHEPQPPIWDELYGSGFRAVMSLTSKNLDIQFFTYADQQTEEFLHLIGSQYGFQVCVTKVTQSINFFYEHPLKSPGYYPARESFALTERITCKGLENVICFGMIEGDAVIEANRVVFDPQSPGSPSFFSGHASELVYVLNLHEAQALTGQSSIKEIGKKLFESPSVVGVVIKCGADGAVVLERNKLPITVPVYITEQVWPIGSGDVFTAHFGYSWLIRGDSFSIAADRASQAVAYYVNSRTLPIPEDFLGRFDAFTKKPGLTKTIYLAGPFFTMAERWIINEFREALLNVGLVVFSPLHDVGFGSPEQVVGPDLEGLAKADLILALADGLDSGTMFEIGYARSKDKPCIIFAQHVPVESLTMSIGTACRIESDFSTCIYKTVWEVYK